MAASSNSRSGGGLLLVAIPLFVATIISLRGLFVVNPNQSQVLQLFGKYYGTVRESGFHWTNPFCGRTMVSLRVRNFESNHLKVNDHDGNPIEIAAIVVWQVVDTAEAIFDVDGLLAVHPRANRGRDSQPGHATPLRRARRRPAFAARQHGRDCRRSAGRDPRAAQEGGRPSAGGAHQPSGLCAGDRGGHAAGVSRRRPLLPLRQKIVEGAVTMVQMAAGASGREQDRGDDRRPQGGAGQQSDGRAVQRAQCPAGH